MPSDVLVTGATGKTGSRVVDLLRARGLTARAATRTPQIPGQIRFDWTDPDSFAPALDGVRAVYMVAPTGVAEPLAAMRPFIDRAITAGVDRLVLLSSSMIEEGGPVMGTVHGYLRANAPGWSVLRPSWFMQNFSEAQHLDTIRREGRIYSATGDGRVPFIDAGDIAAVAVAALANPAFANGELILTGPATLDYDALARLISVAAGREVEHHRLSTTDLAARLGEIGIPDAFAHILAQMDAAIAGGAEDRVTGAVVDVTGRQPKTFAAFAEDNVAGWAATGHEPRHQDVKTARRS